MQIAVDTETTGLQLYKHDQPFAVSMIDEAGTEFYWQWEVDQDTRTVRVNKQDVKEISDILCSYRRYVFANCTFDLKALHSIGVRFPWKGRVEDVQISSHVLFSDELVGLKYRAKVDLHLSDVDETELKAAAVSARRYAKKNGWQAYSPDNAVEQDYWMPRQIASIESYPQDHPWWDVCKTYAMLDVVRTMALWNAHREWLFDQELYEVYARERKLIPVIYSMKKRGMPLIRKSWKKEIKRYTTERDTHEEKAKRLSGIDNLNSPEQLSRYLLEEKKMPVIEWTKKNNPSISANALKIYHEKHCKKKPKLAEFIESLLSYKSCKKAAEALVNYGEYQVNWILHPNFRQNGTKTTRFSCSNPNTQNISKGKEFEEEEEKVTDFKIRTVFGPRPGRIWFPIDYSQLQLRIFAYITGEQSMLDAFDAGYDFHAFVASKIFGCHPEEVSSLQRRIGKNVNFGFIFGAQPAKIEKTAGRPGLWEVVTKQFPNAHAYMESTKKFVKEHGYVMTPFGYKLWIPRGDRGFKSHAGVNYIVQGCLPKSTNVLTKSGWKSIGDCGVTETLWTGERWAEATKRLMGYEEGRTVTLSDGRVFRCDKRHSLLTVDGPWPKWCEVDKLVGKELVRDECQVFGEEIHDIDDFYWLGRFIGDGHHNSHMWSLVFSAKEKDDFKKFCKWLDQKDISGKTNSSSGYSIKDSGSYITVSGGTKKMKDWLTGMGYKDTMRSKSKRIPSIVFSANLERRKAFFDGYFDADGCNRGNHKSGRKVSSQKITSVNRKLLQDTLQLMQTIGLTGRLSKKMTNKKGSSWYDLWIHKTPQPLIVTSVRRTVAEDMYTFTVHDDKHSYSSEGLISKNCEGDIVKNAMIKVHNYLHPRKSLDAHLMMQVHDELIFDFPKRKKPPLKTLRIIKQLMEEAGQELGMKTPVDVDVVTDNWGSPISLDEYLCH